MNVGDFNKRVAEIRTARNIPIPTLKPDLSNIKEIREYMNTAKYIKGFNFDIATGVNLITNIKLTGEAQFLLGIKFSIIQGTDPQTWPLSRFTWTQNNDVVIDDSAIEVYTSNPQRHIYLNEYFTLFRPLNGMDTFKLQVNNPGDAFELRCNVYYI